MFSVALPMNVLLHCLLHPGWTSHSMGITFSVQVGFPQRGREERRKGGEGEGESEGKENASSSVQTHTACRFMSCGQLCPRGCPLWSMPVAFAPEVPPSDRPEEWALVLIEASDPWPSQEPHFRMACQSAELLGRAPLGLAA